MMDRLRKFMVWFFTGGAEGERTNAVFRVIFLALALVLVPILVGSYRASQKTPSQEVVEVVVPCGFRVLAIAPNGPYPPSVSTRPLGVLEVPSSFTLWHGSAATYSGGVVRFRHYVANEHHCPK